MKTLGQEYSAAFHHPNPDVYYTLAQLNDQHGKYSTGPWLVVATSFHGGGILSEHRLATRAVLAVLDHQKGDCQCGCAAVIHKADYHKLPTPDESESPYIIARRG